jgi:16S rRNA (cytosine967-C5)-methyltransferase
MIPAARIQAAIELIDSVEQSLSSHGKPADQLVRSYFSKRRYAGAKDRASVTERVYSVLRRRAEWLWRLGEEASPRLLVAADLAIEEGLGADEVSALFNGVGHGPSALSADEVSALERLGADAQGIAPPRPVIGNYPEWLDPHMVRRFGDSVDAEIATLNQRAPLDLRVNSLKSDRDAVQAALAGAGVATQPTPWSPLGLRAEGRARVTGLPVFKDGLIEVQDEGSQVAASLTDARPGMQVIDLCAGAGGKTLVLAATMENKGQIYGADTDRRRLSQMTARLTRAGARNVQTHRLDATASDDGDASDALTHMDGRADRVLLDVPCSGTGAWRRNPDAKWRLTPDMLDLYTARQDRLLRRGARLTKPGGRLIYVTCSLLRDENEDRITAFVAENSDFQVLPMATIWGEVMKTDCPSLAEGSDFLSLTPYQHNTDGFFVAVLGRDQG